MFSYADPRVIAKRELLELVRRLGVEFARRGMPEVEVLRLYYVALDEDLAGRLNELSIQWSEAHTLEWMRTLRVPPFENAYPVRRFGSGCDRCGAIRGNAKGALAEVVFPGGARMRCQTCGAVWLEEDRAASRDR